MTEETTGRTFLLTGATGFIGRRLLARLLERGHRVRAVSRRPAHKLDLPDHPNLELYRGDALDPKDLDGMFEGCDAAFYLIHSMEGGVADVDAFVERDREAALNFSKAAAEAGIEQIIYVSGLEPEEEVSAHLRSRNDVELYLGEYDVPVTVLRAGFIIGPESAGFQMLDGITGQMSLMMISEDLHHETQPAYVADVVEALALCAEHPEKVRGEVFEIGSEEVVEYFDIIRAFCRYGNRNIEFIEVPWVPDWLASAYISTVSGLSYTLVAALAKGLRIDLYVTDTRLYEHFPELGRTPPGEAMKQAWAVARRP